MNEAVLRVYEELNRHLPEGKRKKPFPLRFEGSITVAALVRSVGIPITEVDLILGNGESWGPAQTVGNGDRISVYPVFESFDIRQVERLRDEPLRRPAFAAEYRLRRLVYYLRMLGFDTIFFEPARTMEELHSGEAQIRIFLAGGERQTPDPARTYRVPAVSPRRQLAAVLARFDLYRMIAPSGRCPRCNGSACAAGEAVRCSGCGRMSRPADQTRRVCRFIHSGKKTEPGLGPLV